MIIQYKKMQSKTVSVLGVLLTPAWQKISGEEGDQEWESFTNDKWCSHNRKATSRSAIFGDKQKLLKGNCRLI